MTLISSSFHSSLSPTVRTYICYLQALAGRAEKSNRHGALPCVEVTPKSRSSGLGCLRRALCTGGIDPGDPRNPADNVDHAGMVFFRDVVGVALGKAWVKVSGDN